VAAGVDLIRIWHRVIGLDAEGTNQHAGNKPSAPTYLDVA